MHRMEISGKIFYSSLLLFFCLTTSSLFGQAKSCDFWGQATFQGRDVEAGDVIKAYDPQGVLCGTAHIVSGGWYAIHVDGDDASTTGEDEGAVQGDAIVFRINNESTSIVSGSNIWADQGSVQCQLNVAAVMRSITIQTNPSGLAFTVDGTSYNSSETFNWPEGASKTIAVTSPQDGGTGKRYVYASWSDGGGQSHNYIVGTSNATLTVSFSVQYRLTINSSHGSPQGTGWYNTGTTAAFSVTSPDVQGSTRFIFQNWTGDHSGASTSGSVVMTQARIVGAAWNTQHYLSTAENPDQGGNVTPAPPGGWYNNGVTVSVDAAANGGWEWIGWSGDLYGSTKPANITIDGPKSVVANFGNSVEILINTHPAGLAFTVDGSTYTSSRTFTWWQGSSHAISVNSPQDGGTGKRYVYASWSDGGAQSHNYVVGASNVTVTVDFRTQYELVVNSDHGNAQGSGWYDDGATAAFSVTSPDVQGSTRYIFQNWTGDHNGTSTSGSVSMTQARIVGVVWKTQYYLATAENPDDGGDMTPAPPGGWYDTGSSVSLDAIVHSNFDWTGWSGDTSGMDKPVSIIIDGPKAVTANFGRLVNVRFSSEPAGRFYTIDGEIYNSEQVFLWSVGGTHTFAGMRIQSGGSGTRYVAQSISINTQTFIVDAEESMFLQEFIVPAEDVVVISNFSVQYFLATSEDPADGGDVFPVTPGDWFDAGSNVTLDAIVYSGYQWNGWTGCLTSMTKPFNVVMDSTMSVTANYKISVVVAEDDLNNGRPLDFVLLQNYPNPFNPETHIDFSTDRSGNVKLTVYDVRGTLICRLVDSYLPAGQHEAVWQGKDENSKMVASGIYFYVLQCGDRALKKKCIFIK